MSPASLRAGMSLRLKSLTFPPPTRTQRSSRFVVFQPPSPSCFLTLRTVHLALSRCAPCTLIFASNPRHVLRNPHQVGAHGEDISRAVRSSQVTALRYHRDTPVTKHHLAILLVGFALESAQRTLQRRLPGCSAAIYLVQPAPTRLCVQRLPEAVYSAGIRRIVAYPLGHLAMRWNARAARPLCPDLIH